MMKKKIDHEILDSQLFDECTNVPILVSHI